MAIDTSKFLLAKANDLLEQFRNDEIARLVRKQYKPSAETRIICNMLKDPSNDEYLAEFYAHEAYVTECKAIVDADIERANAESLDTDFN